MAAFPESRMRVGWVVSPEIIDLAFARLHASSLPECKPDDSDQGEKSEQLGKPLGHVNPPQFLNATWRVRAGLFPILCPICFKPNYEVN